MHIWTGWPPPQPAKLDKAYRIDTTRDMPPDWLSAEEYEALRTDPAVEQVGGKWASGSRGQLIGG